MVCYDAVKALVAALQDLLIYHSPTGQYSIRLCDSCFYLRQDVAVEANQQLAHKHT